MTASTAASSSESGSPWLHGREEPSFRECYDMAWRELVKREATRDFAKSSIEQHCKVHLDKEVPHPIAVRELVRGNLSAFTNFISSFSLPGLTRPLSPIEYLSTLRPFWGPACSCSTIWREFPRHWLKSITRSHWSLPCIEVLLVLFLTMTRSDFSYAVHFVCEFMHAPTEAHFQRILDYLKVTLYYKPY